MLPFCSNTMLVLKLVVVQHVWPFFAVHTARPALPGRLMQQLILSTRGDLHFFFLRSDRNLNSYVDLQDLRTSGIPIPTLLEREKNVVRT